MRRLILGIIILVMLLSSIATPTEIIPDGQGGVWICTGWYEDLVMWIHIKINDPNIIYCFADS